MHRTEFWAGGRILAHSSERRRRINLNHDSSPTWISKHFLGEIGEGELRKGYKLHFDCYPPHRVQSNPVIRQIVALMNFISAPEPHYFHFLWCFLVFGCPVVWLVQTARRTPHQKGTQVRFGLPARIPAPYELPWSGLSENIKIKKIFGEVLRRKCSKITFFSRFL